MQVPTKFIFASKTFWLGIAALLIPFLEGVVNMIDVNAEGYAYIMAAIGGLIILLRYLTTQPVTVSGKETKTVDE